MEEELKKIQDRLDILEKQKIPYVLDKFSIDSLNEKTRQYIKSLAIAEGNGILVDSKSLVDGNNMITGLNGDITQTYRLLIDLFVDDGAPSGNYIAFNNNTTDDGLTYITHYAYRSGASNTHNVTGADDTDRIFLMNNCSLNKCRYHAVIDFDVRLSTEAANRRLITMKETAGNNGGAYIADSCYSVSYSRPNLTSLNIYLANSTSYGIYKLYKVIR